MKEVDVGLAADVGSIQRIPELTGNNSLFRELVYTGRNFSAEEALKLGIISNIYSNKDEMLEKIKNLAQNIATKSPVAVWAI